MGIALSPFGGIPVQTTTPLRDGQIVAMNAGGFWGGSGTQVLLVGVHPDGSPQVIARRIVREGLRDVLAWLDHPPSMLTGREVLDKLAGRPVWTPRREEGE